MKLHPVGDALPEELAPLIGPDVDSDAVWLIEQNDPATGAFERYRAMLGYSSRAEALDGFKAAFDDGRGSDRYWTRSAHECGWITADCGGMGYAA